MRLPANCKKKKNPVCYILNLKSKATFYISAQMFKPQYTTSTKPLHVEDSFTKPLHVEDSFAGLPPVNMQSVFYT